MKRVLTLILLLCASVAHAQTYRTDCAQLPNPGTNRTECVQTTDTGGRLAGRTYIHNGVIWIEKAAPNGINNQSGTSYTILNTDGKKLITFSNASAIAVSLPQAGSNSGFQNGWSVDIQNMGSGAVTITPLTSNIDGAPTAVVLNQNQGVRIYSNGSNYFTQRGIGGGGGGAGDVTAASPFGTDNR